MSMIDSRFFFSERLTAGRATVILRLKHGIELPDRQTVAPIPTFSGDLVLVFGTASSSLRSQFVSIGSSPFCPLSFSPFRVFSAPFAVICVYLVLVALVVSTVSFEGAHAL